MSKSGKTLPKLTEKFEKLRVTFDRAAYRRDYDKVYFKQKAVCPLCNCTVLKHHMKRHQATKKCKTLTQKGKT